LTALKGGRRVADLDGRLLSVAVADVKRGCVAVGVLLACRLKAGLAVAALVLILPLLPNADGEVSVSVGGDNILVV